MNPGAIVYPDGITNYKVHYEIDEKYAKKADLLKKVIISELFNNRDPKNDTRNNFSYTVQSMMNQLRYFVPEEMIRDEDTGQSIH